MGRWLKHITREMVPEDEAAVGYRQVKKLYGYIDSHRSSEGSRNTTIIVGNSVTSQCCHQLR